MTTAHDEIIAAFDALSLAVESAPSRKGKTESFLVASMSPTDRDGPRPSRRPCPVPSFDRMKPSVIARCTGGR